jgi:hypothetical protein
MNTVPAPPVRRFALGLPAGSIRAGLVLGVVALICAIILIPAKGVVAIPPYLIYLLFMMLGHYFAAHGTTIATRDDPAPSPLHLPGGFVRILIIIALLGCFGYKMNTDAAGLKLQFDASLEELKKQPEMPLVILGGFIVGVMVRSIVGRTNPPAVWQDIEAWFSLLAFVGLSIAAVIHIIVDPTLPDRLMLEVWESSVGGIIAFYFGERS